MKKIILGVFFCLGGWAGATTITPKPVTNNFTTGAGEGPTYSASSKTFTQDVLMQSSVTVGYISGNGGGLYNLPVSTSVCVAGAGTDSVLCSGLSNTNSGAWGTVSGGLTNDNSAPVSGTIGGGRQNTVTAEYGTIPGGRACTVSGDYGYAAGRAAQADQTGCFAMADATGLGMTCRGVPQSFNSAFVGGYYFDGPVSTFTGVVVASTFNAVGSAYQINGFVAIDQLGGTNFFHGDGSLLTNLPVVGQTRTFTSSTTFNDDVLAKSSVTTSGGFFGDGSGLTNAERNTFTSSKTFTSASGVLINTSLETPLIQARSSGDSVVIKGVIRNSNRNGAYLRLDNGFLDGSTTGGGAFLSAGDQDLVANSDGSSTTVRGGHGHGSALGGGLYLQSGKSGNAFGYTSGPISIYTPVFGNGGSGNIEIKTEDAVSFGGSLNLTAGTGSVVKGAITLTANGAERARVHTNGNFGVGTSVPATTVDVEGNAQFGSGVTKSTFSTTGALTLANNASLNLSGATGRIITQSSVTASGFFGDGSGISGFVVAASSSSTNTKAIDTVSFVQVTTMTVTLRGSRPLNGSATVTISNTSGAGRTYTLQVEKNAVAISNQYLNFVSAGDEQTVFVQWQEPSSSAGTQTYTLSIKSSNGTATQSATSRIISVTEF